MGVVKFTALKLFFALMKGEQSVQGWGRLHCILIGGAEQPANDDKRGE